jgi:hypothetical protein
MKKKAPGYVFIRVRTCACLSVFRYNDDLKNIKRINVKICRANGHYPRTT